MTSMSALPKGVKALRTLRECDDLEIEQVFVFFSELEQSFYADESLDEVDIGMRTDCNRTILHGHVEYLAGAVEHIFALLLAFEGAGHPEGLLERPELPGQPAMEHCLLQMQVRFNQP